MTGFRCGGCVEFALAIGLALVSLAGCSYQGPDGFADAEWNGARFAHPQEWEVVQEDAAGLAAYGPEGTGGVTESAYLAVDEHFAGDFQLGVDHLDRESVELYPDVFRNRQRLRDDPVDVRGAQQARLLEYVYESDADAGGTVRVRKIDVFAHAQDGKLVYLSISAAEDDFDVDRAASIVGSLRVQR